MLIGVLVFVFLRLSSVFGERSTFIVHMAEMPLSFKNKSDLYEASVRSLSSSAEVLYTYNNAIQGFSARLTSDEVEVLKLRPLVLAVVPEVQYQLQTTRTPFFLGLEGSYAAPYIPHNRSISDVVVGIIDTGVWPERKSFDDAEFPFPPPTTWKGQCEEGQNFTALFCNRKLVGARFFLKGYEAEEGPIDESKEFRSPRDKNGHGTHTSSTAVGSAVKGANFLGYASGQARGMAPLARLAVYKACWTVDGYCMGSDVLAAIDKAIEDNVNVLSMSFGLGMLEYHQDFAAIGALAATERGIVVFASAGNYGPRESTLLNVAPWITTVGAGTVDRAFPAMVTLGNGNNFWGVSSLFKGNRGLLDKQSPLVYSEFGGNVSGKIVLVDIGSNGVKAESSSYEDPLGFIYANTGFDRRDHLAPYSLLPSVYLDKSAGDVVREYVITDSNPTAKILFKGTLLNVKPSPVVAGFSSRGPNPVTPNILKPDLIAPGVNILAAWTGATDSDSDLHNVEFNIVSGTSMSCPHVSGLAALLKAAHPEWSAAAIRSALMTTASGISNDGNLITDGANGEPSTPFAHGAGHVSPLSALNPGLIYDLTINDYLDFLCASNYSASEIKYVARRNFSCDPYKKHVIADLNYPSFAVAVNQSRRGRSDYKYTRIVTNVGGAGKYKVTVSSFDTKALNVSVKPATLMFRKVNEKKLYTVTFTVNSSMPLGTNIFGSIRLSDGRHVVRSPVAVSWN